MKKLNSNCDRTKKLKLGQLINLIGTKLKNSNCDKTLKEKKSCNKSQNSLYDQLKLQQNFKIQILINSKTIILQLKNSNSDNIILDTEQFDTSTTNERFLVRRFVILLCFIK